ncbi:hypothetical protein G7046_g4228 [Stylonectria norvegica]|nr:hypothetical protein G7046_g4228 [Stylonectria norvegica]
MKPDPLGYNIPSEELVNASSVPEDETQNAPTAHNDRLHRSDPYPLMPLPLEAASRATFPSPEDFSMLTIEGRYPFPSQHGETDRRPSLPLSSSFDVKDYVNYEACLDLLVMEEYNNLPATTNQQQHVSEHGATPPEPGSQPSPGLKLEDHLPQLEEQDCQPSPGLKLEDNPPQLEEQDGDSSSAIVDNFVAFLNENPEPDWPALLAMLDNDNGYYMVEGEFDDLPQVDDNNQHIEAVQPPETPSLKTEGPSPRTQSPEQVPVAIMNDNPPKPITRAPKRYRPRHIQEIVANSDNQERHALLQNMQRDVTYTYRGFFATMEDAAACQHEYDTLWAEPLRHTSHPDTDLSFPQNSQDFCDRVRSLCEAVYDWSSPNGWRAKMGCKAAKLYIAELSRKRREEGIETEDVKNDDTHVPPEDCMPSISEQWMNIIHRRMSDIEVELLCCRILNEAIESQKGENRMPLWCNNDQWEEFETKVLIHSATRAPWISRIANAPCAESERKNQNKVGNDRKRKVIEQGGGDSKKIKSGP